MRTIIIDKTTDLSALTQRLGGAGAQALGESIKQLNPHVNLDHLTPSTVLLVPEDAGLASGQTQATGSTQIEQLTSQLRASVEATFAAALGTLEAQTVERKAVADAMKTPTMKRAIEADPDLKLRAAGMLEELKKEQAQSKELEKTHLELRTNALAELDRLSKLTRQ